MAELYLFGKPVKSVFQLLGTRENDITYSIAWALSNSPKMLEHFLAHVTGIVLPTNEAVIRLQQYGLDRSFTDMEIQIPGKLHLIVEAKRGWNLLDSSQLNKYALRFRDSCSLQKIVVASECNQEYARLHLPEKVLNVPVMAVSWKEIMVLARNAYPEGSHREKRLLEELQEYLGGITSMQNQTSNLVYVVSVAGGTPEWSSISWIDIVEKKGLYFHPVGTNGWPKEPPNYIAFRYGGQLQSIHHIEDYEIVENMHEKIPEISATNWPPHFLYKLGPAIRPSKVVKTGNIYPNGRLWCMLDTLLTCDTISEARDLSKRRQSQE